MHCSVGVQRLSSPRFLPHPTPPYSHDGRRRGCAPDAGDAKRASLCDQGRSLNHSSAHAGAPTSQAPHPFDWFMPHNCPSPTAARCTSRSGPTTAWSCWTTAWWCSRKWRRTFDRAVVRSVHHTDLPEQSRLCSPQASHWLATRIAAAGTQQDGGTHLCPARNTHGAVACAPPRRERPTEGREG